MHDYLAPPGKLKPLCFRSTGAAGVKTQRNNLHLLHLHGIVVHPKVRQQVCLNIEDESNCCTCRGSRDISDHRGSRKAINQCGRWTPGSINSPAPLHKYLPPLPACRPRAARGRPGVINLTPAARHHPGGARRSARRDGGAPGLDFFPQPSCFFFLENQLQRDRTNTCAVRA